MNRDYSIIWQALGPAVTRGSDDTELLIFGDGDRDNVGVLLFNTWTKDFRRWRIRGIGTGLWIAGSLNNTLYDPYIAGNEFGVVVGSNEAWGTGARMRRISISKEKNYATIRGYWSSCRNSSRPMSF